MKKIKYLIFSLVISLFGILYVNAAAGISIKANASTVVVGNKVKVTVTINGVGTGAGKVGGWDYAIDYDHSKLVLVSGNEVVTGYVGGDNQSVTYEFKAVASGNAKVTVKNYALYDFDSLKPMNVSVGSVTIKARTQAEIEASYSTNANLKSLVVEGYELTPSFDKNTTDYTLEVPNEIENINITATKDDSNATVIGDGAKELTEGLNRFEIVVTAEKGNKKTYVVEVTRKELNPVIVNVDGEELAVVRKVDAIEVPAYYTLGEVVIDGETVPALNSDITGYTLLALKNEAGDISLYIYNEDGTYKLYKYINNEGFTFISLDAPSVLDDYPEKKEMNINDMTFITYTGEEESDIVLVYGMNAKTGETGWYKYDTVEETFQRYLIDEAGNNKNGKLYFSIALIFVGISFLTIILLIVLMLYNSKIREKNSKLVELVKLMKMHQEADKLKEKAKKIKEDKNDNKVKETIEEVKENKEVKDTKEVKDIKEEVKEETKEVDKSQLSQRELRRLEKEDKVLEEKTRRIKKIDEPTEEVVEEKKKTRGRKKANKEEKK